MTVVYWLYDSLRAKRRERGEMSAHPVTQDLVYLATRPASADAQRIAARFSVGH